MKPIRLKVRDSQGVVDTMLVEDRGAGLDIRREDAPFMDADRSQTVDLEAVHCNACIATIGEQIGLTDVEEQTIVRWRNRKEDGVSSKELGRILDKIVKMLGQTDTTCTDEHERFVIEVEETHG